MEAQYLVGLDYLAFPILRGRLLKKTVAHSNVLLVMFPILRGRLLKGRIFERK